MDKHNDSNIKKNYEKLVGNAGIGGTLYQIRVLTMVLLNGLRKIENWRLSTENKAAPQFDDMVFEQLPFLESTILLQAKHKEDEKKEVTLKDLMSVDTKSEFGLPKYFVSYQEVKTKFNVGNVVICTNLNLAEKVKGLKGVKKEDVDADSVLHFEGAENICYGFSSCTFPKLKDSIEYYAKKLQNKEIIISDGAISDLLNHLKFFPNCLSDKNVENVIEKTIPLVKFSEKLNIKMVQKDIHQKMTDWFKEKRGRYLTEVEAKAFFCEMRSNKYCEDLTRLYDICFKRKNLPLSLNASGNDPKRISHIIPDKEYMLNVVKIHQTLPTHHKEKALFVNPDETIKVQMEIIDAFVVQHYTILVMVCPNTIEDTAAGKMCDRMVEILNTYKYKHVILIAEENNSLAIQLNANFNSYEVITDNITFADLEDTTQGEFKRNKLINFQGYTMSLDQLFTQSIEDDLNQIVNSEMIIKLARGDIFKVGLELAQLDKYYIRRSFIREGQNISEDDLWRSTEDSKEKVILISDSAGMGKSSVLTSLGVSIKKHNPSLWVIRIDLNSYTNIMSTALEKGRRSVSIIEMLNSEEKSELDREFEKELFTTSKRVVLMLDGFDEISPRYAEFVINLIKDSVAQVNFAKIFVTTRPHMSKNFEEISELQSSTFQSSSKNHQENNPGLKFFTFEPFSKVNQIDFLMRYWTETLNLQNDVRKGKCKIFAESLIEYMSKWINERDQNDFAGIPLQTRMLAEIFQEENETHDDERDWEGCKEFLSSNNQYPKLPPRIDIAQLYEMFINKKYDIYIRKNNPTRQPAADEALRLQLRKCRKFHHALALKEIFDSDEQQKYFTRYTKNVDRPIPTTFANNFLFGVGIVQRQGGNIEFLHRTFAEYFVTDCVLIEFHRKNINKVFQGFFMESIMMDRKFSVIRAFLNSRMADVLQNDFHGYFRRNHISKELLKEYFHVFVKEGHARILECFVKCIDKEQRETLSMTVNYMFRVLDIPLSYAILRGYLDILKLLLDLNETFNKGIRTHKEFLKRAVESAVKRNLKSFEFLLRQVDNGKNILGRSALHEAAFMYRLEEVKSLVEEGGADINSNDNTLGWTALHEAAIMGRLEVTKFLVEAGADINVTDVRGETALHRAAFFGSLVVVKFLVEAAGVNINITSRFGETALHRAAYIDRLEVVKFLVEAAGVNINATDLSGATAFDIAASQGHRDVIKYLSNSSA